MKRTWLAMIATMAVLLGVNVAAAQAPAGSYIHSSPTGEKYLMIPNGNPVQPASLYAGPETQKESCESCCDDCFVGYQHCYYAYGGMMYLRARDSEVAYAVGVNNAVGPGVQMTRVAVADQDYQPGVFAGFGMTLDECSSIGVHYMQYEASTNDTIGLNPNIQQPFVINSLVIHPGTLNVGETGLDANATYDIRFNIADIEYRQLISGDCYSKFNWLVGLRLAQAEQNFQSVYSTNVQANHTIVTDVDFYGAGLKMGLEYEKIGQRGFMVYGRTNLSLVPGEFQTSYRQTSAVGGLLVDTSWKAGRLVTMADIEVGTGWVSACGTWRLTAGYNIQAWFNTVQTDEWIRGVQTNNFIDMSSMQSFDGLMARIEARF